MYDVRCDALARHFLSDMGREKDERAVAILAQIIQDAIEDELQYGTVATSEADQQITHEVLL